MAHERGQTFQEGKNRFVNRDSVGKDKGRQLGPAQASEGAAVQANKLRSRRTKKGKLTGKEFLTGPVKDVNPRGARRIFRRKM